MTKQQEISTIRQLAEKLGTDSYLGPWLLEQIPFLEQDLRSDLHPQVSLRQCAADCAALRQEADQYRIEQKAAADKLVAQAKDEAARIRWAAREQVHTMCNKIKEEWT